MTEYFHLQSPCSRRLQATDIVEDGYEVSLCPVTSGMSQHRAVRRVEELSLEVSHRKRDELMIWSMEGPVIHGSLLDEFERRGITGFRWRPAEVRFRDGYLSLDYFQLLVTGWGGVARSASGIRLMDSCAGCGYQKYSGLEDASELVDWNQWTGDDFFIVWPLPRYPMITARVVDTLTAMGVKSYRLDTPASLERRARPAYFPSGYAVGRLSQFLPEDLALRYGKDLGLE